MSYDLNKYEESACIGFWRSGAESGIIAAILDCTIFAVEKAIHDYQMKLKAKKLYNQ